MDQLPDGVTYRQLDYWQRTGRIKCRSAGQGSGIPREWDAAELRVAERMGRLLKAGLTLDAAASIARTPDEPVDLGRGVTVTVTERRPLYSWEGKE